MCSVCLLTDALCINSALGSCSLGSTRGIQGQVRCGPGQPDLVPDLVSGTSAYSREFGTS